MIKPSLIKQSKNTTSSLTKPGFTIVELLVVIVVIGILASITIVAYANISQKAVAASMESDLKNSSTQIEIDKTISDDSKYPTSEAAINGGHGLKSSPGNTLTYVYTASTNSYCLAAVNDNGSSYYITNNAQTPTEGTCPVVESTFVVAWGGIDWDYGRSTIEVTGGGYVAAGFTGSYDVNGGDLFLSKFSSDGTVSWSKTWGGAGSDYGYSVAQTNDDGYVVAGMTNSFGAGDNDAFLNKYGTDGSLLWSKTWGGASDDKAYSVVDTADGGCAITGEVFGFGAGNQDVFLNKYDSSGNLSWSKTWGGANNDHGRFVYQTADDGFIVTGYQDSYGAGGNDMFINKYTSDGTLSWSKTWGGAGTDYGFSAAQASDGGYVVFGQTDSYGAGGVDMFLNKYTSDGTLSWSKTWGGAGTDIGNSVARTSDNGYVTAGNTGSFGAGNYDISLNKYTSDGTLSWSKTWGGANYDYGNNVIQTSDSGYMVTSQASSYGAGSYDLILVKYDSEGLISGCTSPMCQSPSATETTPSATQTSPSATITSPSATVTTPSATETSPSATITTIIAP